MPEADSILGKLRRSRFARDTLILSGGTAIGHSVTIAVMPVLSRIYAPADFGLLALFVAVAGITATILTLRYETSIPLARCPEQARLLVRLCIGLNLCLGVSLAIAAYVLPAGALRVLGVSALGPWLPAAIVAGMAASLIATATYWLIREGGFIDISKIKLVQGGMIAVLALMAGAAGIENGLLLGQLLGQIAPVFLIAGILAAAFPASGAGLRMGDVARLHKAAPQYLLPASLLDNLSQHLPVFLIAAWFSQDEVGQFCLAWRVLMLPMVLIGAAIGQVFYQRFSQAWPDRGAAYELLIRTWRMLCLAGIIPAIVMMIFGSDLFSWVFGREWTTAGELAGILAPLIFVTFVSSPTSTSYLVLGMQKRSLFFAMTSLVYRPGAFFFGMSMNSLHAALVALVCAELVQISFYNWLLVKRLRTAEALAPALPPP